jgi:hypothetical protein
MFAATPGNNWQTEIEFILKFENISYHICRAFLCSCNFRFALNSRETALTPVDAAQLSRVRQEPQWKASLKKMDVDHFVHRHPAEVSLDEVSFGVRWYSVT